MFHEGQSRCPGQYIVPSALQEVVTTREPLLPPTRVGRIAAGSDETQWACRTTVRRGNDQRVSAPVIRSSVLGASTQFDAAAGRSGSPQLTQRIPAVDSPAMHTTV